MHQELSGAHAQIVPGADYHAHFDWPIAGYGRCVDAKGAHTLIIGASRQVECALGQHDFSVHRSGGAGGAVVAVGGNHEPGRLRSGDCLWLNANGDLERRRSGFRGNMPAHGKGAGDGHRAGTIREVGLKGDT